MRMLTGVSRARLLVGLVASLWSVPASLFGQGASPQAGASSLAASAVPPMVVQDASGMTLHAVALDQPLTIDGRLDEDLYRSVSPISGMK